MLKTQEFLTIPTIVIILNSTTYCAVEPSIFDNKIYNKKMIYIKNYIKAEIEAYWGNMQNKLNWILIALSGKVFSSSNTNN